MKIAIVIFPIMEIGGIATYIWNLRNALLKVGCAVDVYHARERGLMRNLSKTAPVLAGRDTRLPGGQFIYGNSIGLKAAKNLLNSYDAVIMGHQCPHPNIRGEGSRAWQELYDLRVPIATVFHDNIWEKAYPWLAEVAGRIRVCFYTNPSIWAGSARSFPGLFAYTPQLLDTTKAGLWRSKKEGRVVWLPQWKAWKGIGIFVRSLPAIDYPVHLYNSGIEYHYLKKEPEWGKWIGRDEYTKVGNIQWEGRQDHIIKGPILNHQVRRALRRANVSVDLTGHKPGPFLHQTTYVHFESMVYGAVAVVPESVVQKPSPIPPDCVYPIAGAVTPKSVAKAVNWVMEHEKSQKEIARTAKSWVQERFDDRKIAFGIVSLLETKGHRVTKATRIKLPTGED